MVFAPIRKYKYRKQLERAGIPESSPSHNIAMDIALRFPGKIEDDLFLLDDLSYQNPDEFKQELEAIWEVYQYGKRSLVTTFSTLGLPFKPLKKLIEIYGQGDSAGNILRALSGIRVGQDGNAESIYDARNRIGGQKADEFTVPEAALSVSKSPDEFLSNYIFSLLIFTELGFHHPGPCYEHVADLTRRHPNSSEYRKRLEHIMTENAREFFEPERKNKIIYGLPTIVTYAFPTAAFLAERGKERDALDRIRNFTQQLDSDETVDKIGGLSSTPAELVNNSRLYGRLANSIKSAPYLDLVKAVNEQRDSTEDECVGALTGFYEKIKDTSEYKFSDYLGDSGPVKIWEEFFRASLLPTLLTVNRAGDFDVHLRLTTHTDSGYDDYMGDWSVTYIDAVNLDISKKK
jgi:hypothetical protein